MSIDHKILVIIMRTLFAIIYDRLVYDIRLLSHCNEDQHPNDNVFMTFEENMNLTDCLADSLRT